MLKPGTRVWCYFPKGTSDIQTDLTRDKGWDALLKSDSIKWLSLVSFNDTWSSFLLRLKTEKDKEEAEKLIKSMGHYFKMTSIAGMLLALIMYIVHSIDIVILVAIVEVIMFFMLFRYQKRQDKRIMQLISSKIPIEHGSHDYIMFLENWEHNHS